MVTSEDGGKTASCAVEVKDTPVTYIKITNAPSDLNVKSGNTFTPEVKVLPENASNKDFTVTVDDSRLASVNGKTVTFLNDNGYVNVTVTSKATSSIRDVLEFRVWVPVKSIEFNLPTPKVTLGVGKKYTLSVAYTPSNAGNKKVTYKASDPSIISVSDSEITGLAPGTCTVTATSEDNPSATASIEVIVKATNKVSINGGEAVEYLTGNLSKTLAGKLITSLKWTSDSYLDSDDAGAFRVSTLANYLTSLDMSKVHIIEGGNPYKVYFESYLTYTETTTKDEFPKYLLYRYNKLKTLILPESVTSIGTSSIEDTGLETITIPNSVKTIRRYSLSRSKLKGTIVIPDSVELIEVGAFESNQLSHIKIGASATFGTADLPFRANPLLEDYEVSSSNPNFKSADGVLLSKDGQKLIAYPASRLNGKVKLPAGFTTIGLGAIEVPTTAVLESISVPEGVTTIDGYGINGVSGVLILPSTLENVDGLSFFKFQDANVVLKATTPPYCTEDSSYGPFYEGTIHKLYVPKASLKQYKNSYYWGDLGDKIASIEDIGDSSDLDFKEVILF
ncbi:MAG: Ig-like domain-containing protein [Bacteroidales bacterium]|nr:Ig-like domain-containing protein [Bacteroidales bacterium]